MYEKSPLGNEILKEMVHLHHNTSHYIISILRQCDLVWKWKIEVLLVILVGWTLVEVVVFLWLCWNRVACSPVAHTSELKGLLSAYIPIVPYLKVSEIVFFIYTIYLYFVFCNFLSHNDFFGMTYSFLVLLNVFVIFINTSNVEFFMHYDHYPNINL